MGAADTSGNDGFFKSRRGFSGTLAMSEFEPLSLSIKDTMKSLSLSRGKVYTLLSDGKLTARKDGGRTLIDYASVKAHHASLPGFVPGIAIPNARRKRRNP
jgi:excisionase family DNA binding protein